jgi:hypothetical protein
MWEPQPLTVLWAFMACYRDSFTFFMVHSPNIIMVIRAVEISWAGHVACMRQMRNSYKILGGNPECKGLFGWCRHRREDYIIGNLKEIDCEDVKWIQLAQHRVQWWASLNAVNIVLDLLIPATGYSELNTMQPVKYCDTQQWGRLVSDLKSKQAILLRISCTDDSTHWNMGAFRNSEQNKFLS